MRHRNAASAAIYLIEREQERTRSGRVESKTITRAVSALADLIEDWVDQPTEPGYHWRWNHDGSLDMFNVRNVAQNWRAPGVKYQRVVLPSFSQRLSVLRRLDQ